MDREAWRAAIHGVAKSQTRLSDWTELNFPAVGLEKVRFIPTLKKGNAKECSNCRTVHSSHTLARLCSKSFKPGFSSNVNQELPDAQAGFRKGKGTRDQVANIHWIIEKSKRIPEKHLLLLHWLRQSFWLCGSQQTVENIWRDGDTRPPDLPPEKPVCRSRGNS